MDYLLIAQINEELVKELLAALKEVRYGAYDAAYHYRLDDVSDSIYDSSTTKMLDRTDELISRTEEWIRAGSDK